MYTSEKAIFQENNYSHGGNKEFLEPTIPREGERKSVRDNASERGDECVPNIMNMGATYDVGVARELKTSQYDLRGLRGGFHSDSFSEQRNTGQSTEATT